MLTLQQIIDEADLLVPNDIPVSDKVIQLNSINGDFFNTVKIPKVQSLTLGAAGTYTLNSDVREKNIDYVQVGILRYNSLDSGDVNPLQNKYSFEDTTHTLTLSPAPYLSGLQGIVRYRRIATTTFVSGALNASPDAPEEYHWTYIPALAAFLANAMDDSSKASNYEAQYRSAWAAAAQDHGVKP